MNPRFLLGGLEPNRPFWWLDFKEEVPFATLGQGFKSKCKPLCNPDLDGKSLVSHGGQFLGFAMVFCHRKAKQRGRMLRHERSVQTRG